MSADVVLSIAEKAIYTILMIIGPAIGIGLAVGLLVSIFQATTQIQEQTLAFIPKIVAIMLSIVFFGPWMLNQMVDFAFQLYNNLHRFVG